MVFARPMVPRALKLFLSFQQNVTTRSTIFHHCDLLFLAQIFKSFNRPFLIGCVQRCIAKVPYQDADIMTLQSRSVSLKKKIIPSAVKISKDLITINGQSFGSLDPEQLHTCLNKFNLYKLKPESLDKYGAQISDDHECLLFPLLNYTGDVLAIQYLESCESYIEAFAENIFPHDNYPDLYGWTPDFLLHDTLVITSNPLDAIAVYQETEFAAVSFPFKWSPFPSKLFSVLNQFQKVILWFSEVRNWVAQKPFIKNLGRKAFIASTKKYSSPLLALENGLNVKAVLAEAVPLKHDGVDTCLDYKESTYDHFKNHDLFCGLKWQRFFPLNSLLKGHRPGELTIFSGQTGTGKTTFMSEYSLDLCMQGLYTLWGSFEVPNHRLLKTMLTQFSSYSLKDNLEKFESIFSKFEDLPMFFIKFDADSTLDYVIKAMTFMVEYMGVQHIVIDNLQFMLNNESLNSFSDYWHRQDQIYSAFRRFATLQNCHITLVMHPRKEPEFNELHSTSISGNARAIQEADNILILQTTKSRQYLEITKNRFDGDKGCILLEFNKNSLTYSMKRLLKNS